VKIPKTEEPTTWGEMVYSQIGEDGTAPLGPATVTAVKSNTEEGRVYYLIDLSWIVVCTCDGFRFRSECSHARAYRGD
jgi:hypothetical protein